MNNPDKIFKDKLFDLETPLGGNVSFEKVIAKRNTHGGATWWKPALLVFATMSAVSLTGFFWLRDVPNSKTNAEMAVSTGKNGGSGNLKNQQPTIAPATPTVSLDSKGNTSNTASTMQTATGANFGHHVNINRSNQNGKQLGQNKNSGAWNTQKQDLQINAQSEVQTVKSDATELHGTHIKMSLGEPYVFSSEIINPALLHELESSNGKFKWPFDVELMMYTGTSQIKDFTGAEGYSIKGVHRTGQYNAIALYSLSHGIQIGAGLGFGQFAGNGEWMNIAYGSKQVVSSRQITIVQPGLPDRTVTVFDTNTVKTTNVTRGNVAYRMDKLSIPLAFRMHFGQGRTLFRVSAQIAPGFVTGKSGDVFNGTEFKSTKSLSGVTLDSRIGAGLYYTLSKRMAIIAEPSLNYQALSAKGWTQYNRFSFGLGFGLVFKP